MTDGRKDFGWVLERSASMLAIGSALSIALSVTYNWGFFYRLNLLPYSILTLADVIRSAMDWLPPAILWIVVQTLVQSAIIRGWSTKSEKSTRQWSMKLQATAMLAFAFLVYFLTNAQSWLFLPFLLMGGLVLIVEIAGHPNKRSVLMAIVAVAMTVFSFALGNEVAGLTLGHAAFKSRLTLTGSNDPVHIEIIRNLDTGLLYLDKAKGLSTISFQTWDSIEKVTSPTPVAEKKPRICTFLRLTCG